MFMTTMFKFDLRKSGFCKRFELGLKRFSREKSKVALTILVSYSPVFLKEDAIYRFQKYYANIVIVLKLNQALG